MSNESLQSRLAALRSELAGARELEVAHPRLSATLGGIIDTLAFYGL
jgi:hypothetical protein